MALNINIFLSAVMIGLSMIYFLFKPMNLKEVKDKEIAQFSLVDFTLHELDQNGLVTKMDGDTAVRYTNRYIIHNINYEDKSNELQSNMKAKRGVYKNNNIVYLDGDVRFERADGLRFASQKAKYDKNKDIASTDVEYVAYMGENYITGSSIKFDNINKTIKSKNIYAIYNNLEEKKK